MFMYAYNKNITPYNWQFYSAGAVQAQHNNNEISSHRFLNKGFVHYFWCDLLTSNAIVAHSRLSRRRTCLLQISLKLESIQHVQLLTAEWNYVVNKLRVF